MKTTKTKSGSRGFTLIAALLLMALLSAISIGLLMMVNTEARVGSHDLQNDMAYRAAEGGMEQMTAQMANLVATTLNPTTADFTALNGQSPSGDPTVAYPVYTVVPNTKADGSLRVTPIQIAVGPYAGLNAQIISAALNVTARRVMGDEVTMMRNVEVALIPVFQFGFFSNGDLSFFASPDLSFNGRIHTNGDLYLGVSNGATLAFNDKITVAGNVVGAFLPNGLAANGGSNDAGPVYILTATDGCASMMPLPIIGAPGPNCKQFPLNKGSVVGVGGNPLLSGAQNPSLSAQDATWPATSLGTFGGFIIDGNYGKPGGTGAKALTLPFVNGAGAGLNASHQIITRPPQAESPLTVLGQSRLGNQAQIRVLLSTTQAEEYLSDSDTPGNDPAISLDNADPVFGALGVPVAGVVGGNSYFAMASDVLTPSWPGGVSVNYDPPVLPAPPNPINFVRPAGTAAPNPWPLIGGFLRVEVKETDGKWHGVTQEWLKLGFARGIQPPGTPVVVHPNAILIFQELADRDGDGKFISAQESTNVGGSANAFNWYPINFYDAREGEDWDPNSNNASCTANGVMNAVELDVGNLQNWLATSVNGKLVDSAPQNGYILYFSDRRGMQLLNGTGPERNGEYGFEDTINLANNGAPDGVLEPINPIQPNYSPEDVNGSGILDNYGVIGVGDAFGVGADTDGGAAGTNTGAANRNPYKTRFNCYTTGRKNRVTGARHVLKLVDGAITKLPTQLGGTGGFTVASENPVYIQGNYNSDAADTVWATGLDDPRGHAAAGVIADAVTLLSNNWQDAGYPAAGVPGSMSITANSQGKNAVTTYYRVAIAGGVGMAFNNPTGKSSIFFGTDGGVHNFLRFLENWGGNGGNPLGLQTLYYEGSLVKLYNSAYSTGTFKCCNDVYNPPLRHYVFDPNFLAPAGLPPGTPLFRDVESTAYRQDFTPDVTNTQ